MQFLFIQPLSQHCNKVAHSLSDLHKNRVLSDMNIQLFKEANLGMT